MRHKPLPIEGDAMARRIAQDDVASFVPEFGPQHAQLRQVALRQNGLK